MAKRPDHGQDATQELSASQLLRDLPPAKPPRPRVPVNDVSMWGRKVVGTEEFAPARRPTAPRSRKWILVGALVPLGLAAGAYAYWMTGGDDAASAPADKPSLVAVEPAKPPPAPPPAAAKVAPSAVDAGSEVAKPDPAALAGAPPDAITSVGKIIPAKKAAPGKRTVRPVKRPLKKVAPKRRR